ncbi:MAG: Ribulose-phosphate 3-epimerase [Candidatus Nomurabacteria bacterium GW2011_GWC2_35_35]|nr:MAG: Ribulose-phosphate 3-epimerase [Candidatus Nomurabacteria bacterium GW2011_GWC2_35_35]
MRGAKNIIFHLEAVGDLKEFKNFLEGIDMYIREMMKIGISININTSLEQIFPLINNVDFVQFMGIEKVGFQGQEFNKKVLENIKILKERFPDLVISVDGGVNFETVPLLIEAGAMKLIIGSTIFNTDDIVGTIEEFKNLG